MKPSILSIGGDMMLHCITTDRFKSEYLSMQFYVPLRTESAQELTLLPVVLRRGTRRFPEKLALNRHLDNL